MNKLFKNPYVNGIYAEIYIVIVVSTIQLVAKPNTPDNFIGSAAALSLFVLSAAVMGFIFLGQPLQLYFDGEKKRAINFFMKTVVSFAIITIIIFSVLLNH